MMLFYWVMARLLALAGLLAAWGAISMGRRYGIRWMLWHGMFLLIVNLVWAVILAVLG